MKIDAFDRISILLLILAVCVTFVFYDQMPDPVPTHFGLDGTPMDLLQSLGAHIF